MATIQEYVSGEVCEKIRQAFLIFNSAEGSLNGSKAGKVMLNNVDKLEPKKLTIEESIKLIQKSVPHGPRSAYIGIWRSIN